MPSSQRTKSGCWTCRLRRKKCLEGGPPCANCAARDIRCHGYGPKPDWKDRGDKEREEAGRLQLATRRRRSTAVPDSTPGPSTDSMAMITAPTSFSDSPKDSVGSLLLPVQDDCGLSFDFTMSSFPAQAYDALEFDFFASPLNLESPSTPVCTGDEACLSPTTTNTLAAFELATFELTAPTTALPSSSPTPLIFPPVPDHGLGPSPILPGPQSILPFPEGDAGLVMHFLHETWPAQHSSSRASPMQSGWLLSLLMRSQTYYHASLAMSAYHYSLGLPIDDCEARRATLREYQSHRTRALSGFAVLTGSNEPGLLGSLGSAFQGEAVICAVQIALMEALGNNMQNCQTYLDLAHNLMLEQELFTDHSEPLTPQPSQPSPIELSSSSSPPSLQPLHFYTSLLLFNTILLSTLHKTPPSPSATHTYRRLLSHSSFAHPFHSATGCQPWIFLSLLDITELEAWKVAAQRHGHLSIRELVSRAAVIEAGVEDRLQQQQPHTTATTSNGGNGNEGRWSDTSPSWQTTLFAHALLNHLHTIVSGARPGVPEVRRSVERTMEVWQTPLGKTRPMRKALAWPYYVSASLATGEQREVFRGLVSDSSLGSGLGRSLGLGMRGMRDFKEVVEACWSEADKRADGDGGVDWRDVLMGMGTEVMFL